MRDTINLEVVSNLQADSWKGSSKPYIHDVFHGNKGSRHHHPIGQENHAIVVHIPPNACPSAGTS
jgi:hypothetical protein